MSENTIKDDTNHADLPQCVFDCASFRHICCRLASGKEECRTKDNCPDPGLLAMGGYLFDIEYKNGFMLQNYIQIVSFFL